MDVSKWAILEAFLQSKAKTTQRQYRGVLREWLTWCGIKPGTRQGAERLMAMTDVAASNFRRHLKTLPGMSGTTLLSSTATVAKKLTILRHVYKVLGVTPNPFGGALCPIPKAGRPNRRPTRALSAADVATLLRMPPKHQVIGRRDRAILALLFGGALRRSEVVRLRLSDLGMHRGAYVLRLRETKSGDEQQQVIPDWAGRIVWAWADEVRAEGWGDDAYLIPPLLGEYLDCRRPLSTDRVYQMVCYYSGLVGIRITPHCARATAITLLLDQGTPHADIRAYSRHATIEMVDRYDKRRLGGDRKTANRVKYF